MKLHEIVAPITKTPNSAEQNSEFLLLAKLRNTYWLLKNLYVRDTKIKELQYLYRSLMKGWLGNEKGNDVKDLLKGKLKSDYETGKIEQTMNDIQTALSNKLQIENQNLDFGRFAQNFGALNTADAVKLKQMSDKNRKEYEEGVKQKYHSLYTKFFEDGVFESRRYDMHKLYPELMSIVMEKHVYETNFFIETGRSDDFIKFYIQQVVDQYGKKQFLPEISAVLYGNTQLTEEDFTEPSEVEFILES